MPIHRLVAVGAGALVLLLPAAAQAGTVDRIPGVSVTYVGGEGSETVSVSTDAGNAVVESTDAVTPSGGCVNNGPNRADCGPPTKFVVRVLGGDDNVDARGVLDGTPLEADAGAGADEINATNNSDSLAGGNDDDRLASFEGND